MNTKPDCSQDEEAVRGGGSGSGSALPGMTLLERREGLPDKFRILLVEDHPMMREHVARLINRNSDMEVCGEADNAQDALRLMRERSPDLAIIDVALRKSNGMDLLKDCEALGMKVPMLVLSTYENAVHAERALQGGARGYIPKSETSSELIFAVRKVMAGEVYLNEEMTSKLIERIAAQSPEPVTQILSALSDRDLKVLRLIGKGRSTHEIARELGLSESAVATSRLRIKSRLGTKDLVGLYSRAAELIREHEGTVDT